VRISMSVKPRRTSERRRLRGLGLI
jgi:hypothetical protein